jgi:ABC-type nitrate/sulfonate/bicarbonate transport system ATPase subunit
MNPKLDIRDITLAFESKRQKSIVALDQTSIEIGENEFAVIVGPSGCGKSSLLRVAAGLMKPTTGSVLVDGKQVTRPGRDRGMVFQSYTLFPWLNVLDNVAFGPSISGMEKDERVRLAAEYIMQVGLQGFERAYPKQLSGGMMQRVAMARALANNPEILLMDEPFGALDSQTRSLMQELLLKVWERHKKTVLFVTHDIDEAILLGDSVYVMTARPGKIKQRLPIRFERPRSADLQTMPEFVALKRQIMNLIHAEAEKSAFTSGVQGT